MSAIALLAALFPLITGPLPPPVPAAEDEAEAGDAERAAFERRAREVWGAAKGGERHDLVEWFRFELGYVDTLQNALVAGVLARQERDPGLWPDEAGPRWFEPQEHTGGVGARRRPLAEGSRLERARERFGAAERTLRTRWRYDWASGELRRRDPAGDLERQFENAVAGFGPNVGLARELVLRELDDGSRARTLDAFSHAYVDRSGNVHPGVTLYDAWRSGETIEMPDVDTLGIVHVALDEWNRWKLPVSGATQSSLYERIGELFLEASRHRDLREALADTFVSADGPQVGGYEGYAVAFHALWEEHAADPASLRATLPAPEGWRAFLEELDGRVRDDEEFAAKGWRRRAAYAESEARVRATFAWVLDERERRARSPQAVLGPR